MRGKSVLEAPKCLSGRQLHHCAQSAKTKESTWNLSTCKTIRRARVADKRLEISADIDSFPSTRKLKQRTREMNSSSTNSAICATFQALFLKVNLEHAQGVLPQSTQGNTQEHDARQNRTRTGRAQQSEKKVKESTAWHGQHTNQDTVDKVQPHWNELIAGTQDGVGGCQAPHPSVDLQHAIGCVLLDEKGDTEASRQRNLRRPEGEHPSIVPSDDAPKLMHPEHSAQVPRRPQPPPPPSPASPPPPPPSFSPPRPSSSAHGSGRGGT